MKVNKPGIAVLLLLFISAMAAEYGITKAAGMLVLILGGVVVYKLITAPR